MKYPPSSRKIRGLWSLPGGTSQHLRVLDQAVKHVASQTHSMRTTLVAWFTKEYGVSLSATDNYIQVLTKLGVIRVLQDESLEVTSLGQSIIDAKSSQAKARLVLRRFLDDYAAFPEVLALFVRNGDEAVHFSEVGKALLSRFPTWTTDTQLKYRVYWLLSLGALEQVAGRTYRITDFGRNIAVEYGIAGEPPPPPQPNTRTRYHAKVSLNPLRMGSQAELIGEDVVAHLAGLGGATIRVTLEIDVEVPFGVPEDVVRIVEANSHALRFTNHAFDRE